MIVKINKACKYRLYPTKEQEVLLAKHFGCCRWMYNYGLEQKKLSYEETGKSRSRYDIQSDIPRLKIDNPWLREINAQSLQYSLLCLDNAYKKFFRDKKGFPKFKSKWNKQSFTVPQKFRIEGNKLVLPKFQEGVKVKLSREIKGKLCSATISKIPSGKYFVSILTEQERDIKQKLLNKETAIGLDLGLKDFVITSDGKKYERRRHLKKEEKRIKKLSRKLAKQKKCGKNRKDTKIKLARSHERIANSRNDYIHKVTRQLINETQVDTYCLEDLNVQGMMKNHKLAKSIGDVSWSEFVRQIKYKANWSGKNIIQIGRFEASSKTCNHCGLINNELALSDRIWKCDCGVEHDRDINAAINIRDFAFSKVA
jgi:putative transposase